MTSRNVAVFIDAENLFKGYGKLEIPDVSMSQILQQLEAAASQEAGSGSIAMSRAYADWAAIGLENYRRDVERAGVETVQVFSAGKAEKNAADIVLVVDCLRAAADLDQLEVFILVSADGDFVPLVRRLHELDKYVIGATLADHPVNSLLEREVDQYVALKVTPVPPPAALNAVFSADPLAPTTKPAAKKPAAKAPAAKAPAARKSARKGASKPDAVVAPAKATKAAQAAPVENWSQKQARQPVKQSARQKQSTSTAAPPPKASGKPNWHELAKDIPVVHAAPASSPADYKAIIKTVLLDSKVRSFFDQLANHGGTLPILAMAIKAAAPRLSPSDARVSTLSRALRFALSGTQYALARESDDVQPVLVRRSADPAGMLSDLTLDDIERGVQ